MHYRHRLACALFAGSLLSLASGCLSIGGKTYQTDSPDADKRLSSLETRVGVLERALIGTPSASTPVVPVESLPPGGTLLPTATPSTRATFAPYNTQNGPPR